jgi:hypothetical protein
MKRIGTLVMALLSLWALEPSAAFGGRPLATEDAGTVEKGFFELELAFDYSRDNNRDKNYIPSAQLAYGLTERAEVALAGSYLFKDVHEGGREDGWGDGMAYLKYRVWGEGENYPAFSLKPQVKIPAADENKGLGSGKADYGLTAVFSKSFTGLNLHFNTGYGWIGEKGATDEINLALAGEYEVRKGLLAVSEIRYTNNFNSDRNDDPASILLGLQVPVGKVLLDAGLSLGLNTAAPDYVLTMGVTIKFH